MCTIYVSETVKHATLHMAVIQKLSLSLLKIFHPVQNISRLNAKRKAQDYPALFWLR